MSKALNEYMWRINQLSRLCPGKVKAYTLDTAEGRQEVAQKIDCDLSPENLSCDGEASVQHVRMMRKLLTQAAKDLSELDPTVKFYEVM